MKKANNRIFIAVGGFFLAAALFILFNGALNPGSILFGSDFINIYLPFSIFAGNMFHYYHQLPLWMPHLFFGFPLIASSSLIYYYPTDFIFMLLNLPPQYMGTFDIVLHMLAAFAGMFLFLRETGIRKEASFFSAFTIMISGYIVSYIYVGHWNNIKAGALIPFVFYFIQRGLNKKKLVPFLNAAIFMALQILATGMQIMAYTMMGVMCLIAYRFFMEKEARGKINVAMYFALAIIFTLLFSSLQLAPSIPYTDFSWRGNFSYDSFISWSLHPAESLTLILPHLFGFINGTYYGAMPFNMTGYYFGAITMFLAIPAFLPGRHRNFAIFSAASALVFLVLSWGGFTPVYCIFYHIPVFKQFRTPSRFMCMATFFICVLSAIGLDNIFTAAQERKGKDIAPYFKITAAIGGLISLIFVIIVLSDSDGVVSFIYRVFKNGPAPAGVISIVAPAIIRDAAFFSAGFALLCAVTVLLLKGGLKNFLAAALVLTAFNFIDIQRIDSKFINFADYNSIVPAVDPIASVIKKDNGLFRMTDFSFDWGSPNKNIYYDIEGLNGIHGLIPEKFVKMRNDGVFNFLNNDRYFNVKYYVTKQDINVKGFEKVFDDGRKVYMDPSYAPRFDFTDRLTKLPDAAGIYNLIKSGNFDFKSVLIKDDIELPYSAVPLSYKIGLSIYSPNRIKMRVECSKDGMLVVKNSWYPDWKVKVDNKAGKIYNVDYCFMGIPLTAGTHDVDIYYSMGGFYAGLLLTLLGLAGYFTIFFIERRKKGGL